MSARLREIRREQPITIRAEKVAPGRLTDGSPPGATSRLDRTTRAKKYRHYTMKVDGISARTQLNHGDKASDAVRLRDIAENMLTADLLPDDLETQPTPGPYWCWTADKGLVRGVR